MIIERESQQIWIRQSWLSNFLDCPERARHAIVRPDWEREGDAALCGTAAHAAVESLLRGEITAAEIGHAAHQAARALVAAADQGRGISWNKFDGVDELAGYAKLQALAWLRDIYPHLPEPHPDDLIEWNFEVPLFSYRGWKVGVTGTADYVPYGQHTDLYDWKFPGRKYRQWEKQKSDVQASIYTLAAVESGLREWGDGLVFNFGVARRLTTSAEGEILPVLRTAAHGEWVLHVMRSAVNLFVDVGLD